MSEWKEYRLGDLLVNYDKHRKPLSAIQRASFKGNYRYYGAQGVIDYVKDYIFDGDYMLIAEDGENLNSRNAPIAQLVSGKFWVNNHAHIVKTNDKADMYLLMLMLNKTNISAYVTGAAQPKLNQDNLNSITLRLPPIVTQHRISSILSSLDDKIAINRRICENLEAQAQALFKHWFIDFAPFKEGKFVESELGMIPAGWRVGTLGEIAEIIKPSIKPQNDVEYSHYSIPAFDNKKMPSCDNGGTIKSNKFMIQDSVTLLSKLNPDHKRIWFVNKVKANAICSTEFIPFYAKERRHSAFIYCYLNSWQNYREIANGAKGTTNSHQRIDANAILLRKIAYDKETINKFCDLVGELLEQENIAIQESSRLSSLRDTILPKLMSGEIKV